MHNEYPVKTLYKGYRRLTIENSPESEPGREFKDFLTRWKREASRLGHFCLGIDPSAEILDTWGLPDTVDGVMRFCERVSSWTEDRLPIVKPQIAFFERFGSHGIKVLEDFVATMRRRGTLVLMDAKRGDIGSTVEAYSRAFFDDSSPLRSDAVTANGYLGLGALGPLLSRADNVGGAVFVVVASSNAEGIDLQKSIHPSGHTIAEHLAGELGFWNEQNKSIAGGAVIGATRTSELPKLLQLIGGAPVLLPGIGAQGASFSALRSLPDTRRLIPTSSRSVLSSGPSRDAFLTTLDDHIAAASSTVRGDGWNEKL